MRLPAAGRVGNRTPCSSAVSFGRCLLLAHERRQKVAAEPSTATAEETAR